MKREELDRFLMKEPNAVVVSEKLKKEGITGISYWFNLIVNQFFTSKIVFDEHHKLITIWGVFGALTIYSTKLSPKAAFLSFLIFYIIGVILWFSMMFYMNLVASPIALAAIYLVNEYFSYMQSSFPSYVTQLGIVIKGFLLFAVLQFIAGFVVKKYRIIKEEQK